MKQPSQIAPSDKRQHHVQPAHRDAVRVKLRRNQPEQIEQPGQQNRQSPP